jgi:hypothetical protein
MGRKEVSGANFSHASGRAGAFFTGDWIAERMRTPFILPILRKFFTRALHHDQRALACRNSDCVCLRLTR